MQEEVDEALGVASRWDVARIHVLMARDSPVSVIFRRGPTKQVRMLLWDRSSDEVRGGQWLMGRVYPERSSLSPRPLAKPQPQQSRQSLLAMPSLPVPSQRPAPPRCTAQLPQLPQSEHRPRPVQSRPVQALPVQVRPVQVQPVLNLSPLPLEKLQNPQGQPVHQPPLPLFTPMPQPSAARLHRRRTVSTALLTTNRAP